MASQSTSRIRFGQQSPSTVTGNPSGQQTTAEQARGRQGQAQGNPGRNRDEIARKAYEIWQSEGCPEGRSIQHWIRAEQALSAQGMAQRDESTRPSESQGTWRPEARSAPSPTERVTGGRV